MKNKIIALLAALFALFGAGQVATAGAAAAHPVDDLFYAAVNTGYSTTSVLFCGVGTTSTKCRWAAPGVTQNEANIYTTGGSWEVSSVAVGQGWRGSIRYQFVDNGQITATNAWESMPCATQPGGYFYGVASFDGIGGHPNAVNVQVVMDRC